MQLRDAYITSVLKCAPPLNKPQPEEIAECAPLLDAELKTLSQVRVVVALGKIAFDGYLAFLQRQGHRLRKLDFPFGHGEQYRVPDGRWLIASYHPSLQNTLTGKLTEKMFLDIFRKAKRLAAR